MKNIKITIIAIILITAIFVFTACNKTIIDTKYKFDKAHIRINGEWFDVEIKKWCDYDGEQIQLILTDNTVIVIYSRDCILYNGTLPTAEKTADTGKTFDERVIEVALNELDKMSERKELIFLFAEGEYSEYLLITDDGVYLLGTDSACNVDVEKQIL